jgi:O-methyltransferase
MRPRDRRIPHGSEQIAAVNSRIWWRPTTPQKVEFLPGESEPLRQEREKAVSGTALAAGPRRPIIVRLIKFLLGRAGFELRHIGIPAAAAGIPDAALYRPYFSPWLGQDFARYYAVAAPRSLVTADRCYVIHVLLKQALALDGDIVECGVYRGGTAAMMARMIVESRKNKKLFLFDTFSGMPKTDPNRDLHRQGDFADTSDSEVKTFIDAPGVAVIRKGFIPDTFSGLETIRIAFAHIDVDLYQSIIDSLKFIWPRLTRGGFIVFDDYGHPTCPGARQAVDEFFARESARPLCLATGQAIVFR